jgi:hypothetical protein
MREYGIEQFVAVSQKLKVGTDHQSKIIGNRKARA